MLNKGDMVKIKAKHPDIDTDKKYMITKEPYYIGDNQVVKLGGLRGVFLSDLVVPVKLNF